MLDCARCARVTCRQLYAMKVYLLGGGSAWVQARTILEKVATTLTEMPEIIALDGETPREILAALAIESSDVLVAVQTTPFAEEGSPADVVAESMRREAQKAILVIELVRRVPRTLLLRAAKASEWACQIAELLGANASDALSLNEIVSTEVVTAGGSAATLVEAQLLWTYLMPLLDAAAHPDSVVVTWPRDCFLYGDAPGEGLPATVEVAGRGRILAYGPYMPLPKGCWQATACLGFSADIGGMPFILEVDTDAGITRGFFEVKQGGIFTLELDFEVADPFHPVEFRLISQDSALEGLVSLIEIKLEQSSPH